MTARAFLVRGLLAGLIAGLATFFVAHQVGETSVEAAIGLEESAHHTPAADAGHDHEQDDAVVSRGVQRTWGLLTATLTVGIALGGVVGLVAAVAAGRMRRLTLGQSTALVTAVGFTALVLVPFLKYPANPPAVGDADTIGDRTGLYFGFVLLSLVVAVLATALAVRLTPRVGTYAAVVGATAGYVVVMAVAGSVFPTVNEVGDFPADTLWEFRRASLLTLATMWAVIGVALSGLVLRLQTQHRHVAARRELAASL